MKKPLMPKATAMWLIDNTTLTFDQIASFVGLHPLEIQALADEEVSIGIVPRNPIENGELTKDEIMRCEKNQNLLLKIKTSLLQDYNTAYTPCYKRKNIF